MHTKNIYSICVVTQFTKFLLTSCIPYIELNWSSVGMEHKEMDLNNLLLKFTSQMTLHECILSVSPAPTNTSLN